MIPSPCAYGRGGVRNFGLTLLHGAYPCHDAIDGRLSRRRYLGTESKNTAVSCIEFNVPMEVGGPQTT